ncbi:zinc-dependent MarR family transcriptional regulator [Streptococcus ratti]|uniref:MarR family transcriptional regulator n=2 Tax=Streptococcus ratti TaxID=1341 RepID=A0A7X9QGI9_STRRT|nr:zinc-dependent MarR family transcriptional regulator [Streptococcus ratti]VEI59298.1 transcriptional regulator [Streptococcus mutans]EJN95037.1 putative transcriptional regulator [Streptococcus ratti FA-1 = DSM 20564]EMP69570.1 putative transcriptional regulator [Streptococcus ratti FA-1 = DSM 20564]NMD49538.1 MarR family transcriptional regulator [Streptococcus ratti]QEY06880.1 MarR family transcriptional regulator [Streptococcus ratti]
MALGQEIDRLINQILLKAENQHELLIGSCQSEIKLTNTQEHILMLLSQENLTNSDLAKRLNVSQAAVTKAVKSLVKQKMLESIKDKTDARVTYFRLTELAKPIAQEHEHHHALTLSVYDHLLDTFSKEERAVISRFLTALSKELKE